MVVFEGAFRCPGTLECRAISRAVGRSWQHEAQLLAALGS